MPRAALASYVSMWMRGRALHNLTLAQSAQVGSGFMEDVSDIVGSWQAIARLDQLEEADPIKSGPNVMEEGFDNIQVKEKTRR